ncbi:DUF1674 domain-containing protein [Sulfitobacter aestuariivivens]|uniref:DUF1674 domain-containing protein n=1 Tax=Sulfitobacter aestuariivivens TaxID=2766981 RepID=A0A927D454_9RHOB|nr:DUF1674 domain-containing protein [Sulfitobacter aestuariivivens]MBD3664788.1 DUF1674 domain-containing protein [Sulfitobacter aestuariivivens]
MPNPKPDPGPDLPPQPRPAEKPIPTDAPVPPTPMPKPDLPPQNTAPHPIPPAAQRALAEAEERRRKAAEVDRPKEYGGRDGPDPVRYGDWEKNGIAIDF